MNKGQLIEAVAAELSVSKAAATRAVDAVFNCLRQGIQRDPGVTIVGFGTFVKKQRKACRGRNPVTGQAIEIKASKTVGFRASQALKGLVAV